MMCVVCFLLGTPDQPALVVVNGHSVCDKHVDATKVSTSINVVVHRLVTRLKFGMDK